MSWRTPHRFTGADMLFIGGVLVGLAVAGLCVFAAVLAVVRMMVGG